MKLVFVNRFFHPDDSPTGQLLFELSTDLAARGWEVEVVTSRQAYERPHADYPKREAIAGVAVHRLSGTRYGRDGLLARFVDDASFYAGAFVRLAAMLRKGDIVVATTDPPLMSVVAGMAAALRGAQLVNWTHDLYPEIAERMGLRWVKGPVAFVARRLRNRALRRAAATVVLGRLMADRVRQAAGDACPVRIVHNWADGAAIVPVDREDNELVEAWGLAGKFVVCYSGNMGRVHEFDTIVQAMRALRAETDLRFLFIGSGHAAPQVEEAVARHGLGELATFLPYQPKDRLAHTLSVAHVHLISVNPAYEGLVVPSKFYGIAASGRPAIYIGDVHGEIPRLLAAHDCGVAVACGDGPGLAQAILALKRDPATRERLGANGRQALLRHFDRAIATEQWNGVLESARRAPRAARALEA